MGERLRPLLFALAVLPAAGHTQSPPVQSVPSIDLGRYLGTWYEVAALPMFFQRKCIGDTTADYAYRPDGDLAVVNRCRTEHGYDEAVGRARPVPGTGGSQLKVSFFWPFRADYWILGLAGDYQWAVVGSPDRSHLWLLSRTPQLPREQLDQALEVAARQGFDLSPLKYARHGRSDASP